MFITINLILVSFVLIGTCLTNGSIAVLILRFDSLRTKPNFIILSSCIGDILACFCNLPGFVSGYVFQDDVYFVGRAKSLVVSTLHLYFTLLNLCALTVLMADRFCALKWSISYKIWRTTARTKRILAAKWLGCIVISLLLILPVWDIDLGETPVYIYRRKHFRVRGKYVAFFMFPVFIINNAILATLICYTIRTKSLINTRHFQTSLSERSSELRKRNDIKAMKTISITILLYFVCYVPGIIYSAMEESHWALTDWFGFFCLFAMYIPGFLNPIIFALRTRRFRRALRLLIQDPCGQSELH